MTAGRLRWGAILPGRGRRWVLGSVGDVGLFGAIAPWLYIELQHSCEASLRVAVSLTFGQLNCAVIVARTAVLPRCTATVVLQVHRIGNEVKYFSRKGHEHGVKSDFNQLASRGRTCKGSRRVCQT